MNPKNGFARVVLFILLLVVLLQAFGNAVSGHHADLVAYNDCDGTQITVTVPDQNWVDGTHTFDYTVINTATNEVVATQSGLPTVRGSQYHHTDDIPTGTVLQVKTIWHRNDGTVARNERNATVTDDGENCPPDKLPVSECWDVVGVQDGLYWVYTVTLKDGVNGNQCHGVSHTGIQVSTDCGEIKSPSADPHNAGYWKWDFGGETGGVYYLYVGGDYNEGTTDFYIKAGNNKDNLAHFVVDGPVCDPTTPDIFVEYGSSVDCDGVDAYITITGEDTDRVSLIKWYVNSEYIPASNTETIRIPFNGEESIDVTYMVFVGTTLWTVGTYSESVPEYCNEPEPLDYDYELVYGQTCDGFHFGVSVAGEDADQVTPFLQVDGADVDPTEFLGLWSEFDSGVVAVFYGVYEGEEIHDDYYELHRPAECTEPEPEPVLTLTHGADCDGATVYASLANYEWDVEHYVWTANGETVNTSGNNAYVPFDDTNNGYVTVSVTAYDEDGAVIASASQDIVKDFEDCTTPPEFDYDYTIDNTCDAFTVKSLPNQDVFVEVLVNGQYIGGQREYGREWGEDEDSVNITFVYHVDNELVHDNMTLVKPVDCAPPPPPKMETCTRIDLEQGAQAGIGAPVSGTYRMRSVTSGRTLFEWHTEAGWEDSGLHCSEYWDDGGTYLLWVIVEFHADVHPVGSDEWWILPVVNHVPGSVPMYDNTNVGFIEGTFGNAKDEYHAVEVEFTQSMVEELLGALE